jgi:RNA polymerase sigma-70 factor (ECF subfamily)
MWEASPAAIDALFEQGRARWAGIDVSRDAFAAFLGDRAQDDVQLATLHGADLYLACACAAEDAGAIAAFEARYMSEVPSYLAGVERSPAIVDEVRQLVRQRLFVAEDRDRRKILEYSGRGSLASWVRVVTLRVDSNRRRDDGRALADISDHENDAGLLPTVDPELAIIQTRYKDAFNIALSAAFSSLTPRERLLFRMHYLDGLNIDGIGLVFSVHRATVARWLAGARETILERTMSLLGDELHVDAAEFESLLRVVRSALDVSLHGVLAEGAASAGR